MLSGAYEDDVDNGDTILYTGHGGRDERTGRQIKDQEFTLLNRSLADNVTSGIPVRVVRKVESGFRYDGLYSVDAAYDVLGRSGFRICRYELSRLDPQPPRSPTPSPLRPAREPRRVSTVATRLVRDTARSLAVKSLHRYRCQVCGTAIATREGQYAEGAHVIPLGRPHDGPDHETNIVCLCPNHHVMLDYGGIYISDDLEVITSAGERIGRLRVTTGHDPALASLRHHRARFGFP